MLTPPGKKRSFTPRGSHVTECQKEPVVCRRLPAGGNYRFMLYRSGGGGRKGPKRGEIGPTGKKNTTKMRRADLKPKHCAEASSLLAERSPPPPSPPSGKLPPFLSHPCLLVVYIKYLKTVWNWEACAAQQPDQHHQWVKRCFFSLWP